MRKRLSWDEEKVAEIMKKADPYTMNQDRKNPPVEKYQTGDPSSWAEDPHMATPWKTEGRTETGHPAPAREAVMAARKLEDKAIKCITIAQRMLPGASDETLEEQATDLMYLPEKSVLSTLQRQADLAEVIAGDNGNDDEEEEKKEEEDKEASEEKVEAQEEEREEEKKEEKEAQEEEKEEEEDKEASEEKVEAQEEEKEEEKKEEKEAKKEEMKEDEEEKKVSSEEAPDLLDKIFEAGEEKTGAKKLSGLVKQASSGNNLDGIRLVFRAFVV